MGIISLHIQMLKTTSNILVFSSNYKKGIYEFIHYMCILHAKICTCFNILSINLKVYTILKSLYSRLTAMSIQANARKKTKSMLINLHANFFILNYNME